MEVTQSDFSWTKITLAVVWRMKSRGETRGRKTGSVSQEGDNEGSGTGNTKKDAKRIKICGLFLNSSHLGG